MMMELLAEDGSQAAATKPKKKKKKREGVAAPETPDTPASLNQADLRVAETVSRALQDAGLEWESTSPSRLRALVAEDCSVKRMKRIKAAVVADPTVLPRPFRDPPSAGPTEPSPEPSPELPPEPPWRPPPPPPPPAPDPCAETFAAWARARGYDSWQRLLDLDLKDVFGLDLTATQLRAVLAKLAEEQPGAWGGYLSSERTTLQSRTLKTIFRTLEDAEESGGSGAEEEEACVVCMDGERTATLVHPDGQGHLCVCAACADELFKAGSPCPMCRKRIQSVLKTVWS